MNRPGGAFKQTERSCESKMEGSHPDKLTVSTEKHEAVQVRKSSKASKKDLTKNHFGGKINGSPVERLRRTGPLKLNNIEKLVRNLYVFGKTLKTIPKVIHTGRKRLRAERTRFNTFK